MLEFRPLELQDLPKLRDFFGYSSSRICRIIHSGRRGFVKRQRDACVEKETDRISLLPDSADVFFNGTYDVELAGPFLYGK